MSTWLSHSEEHYWGAADTVVVEGDARRLESAVPDEPRMLSISTVYDDLRAARAALAANPYEWGTPARGLDMRGVDRFLLCAADPREASSWARERGVPVEVYSVATGLQGERGLRGYGGVVFVVLPGYWRSVRRGHQENTGAVFDRFVARQENPITKVVDDGRMKVSFSGATEMIMRLLWALYPRGVRAPDRG